MPRGRQKPEKLTLRHALILVEITEYVMTHGGRFPNVRWIRDNCHYNSTSAVNLQLENLCRMGYLDAEQRGSKTNYHLSGVSVNPPPWFYEVKALYLDRTVDVLDRNWNALLDPLETA